MKLFFHNETNLIIKNVENPYAKRILIKRKSTMVSYQNHRANMVEARGVEPLSESVLTRLSPGAVKF